MKKPKPKPQPLSIARPFGPLCAAALLLLASVPSGALAHSPGHHECQQNPGHIWYEIRNPDNNNWVAPLNPATGRLGARVGSACLHVGNPHRQADSGAAGEIEDYNENGIVGPTISIESNWTENDYYDPVDGTRIVGGHDTGRRE